MFEFTIYNRWTGNAQFACQLEDSFKEKSIGTQKGEAVRRAIESDANLSDADLRHANLSAANLSDADLRHANLSAADLRHADLRRADLSDANLSDADLSDANLSDADLSDADLRRANLRRANLSDANLSNADLRRADLSDANLSDADLRRANLSAANLRRANLSAIKKEFFEKLLLARNEASGLYNFIIEGKVDGSGYEGECACFVGSIAKVCGQNYNNLSNGLEPNSSSSVEIWFFGINKNDTPKDNPISAITAEWLREFMTDNNIEIPVNI